MTVGDLHGKYSERPDIYLVVVILLKPDQLRCHPTYGADLADGSSFLLVELCRITEIGQLDVTLSVDENVVTFDISVNDSSGMQIVKGLKSFSEDVGADLLVDVASSLLQNLSQITNIHKLEEDPELLTVIKCLDALQDAVLAVAHLHDGDFVPDVFVLISVFWLYQLQGKVLVVGFSPDVEYSSEASRANSVYENVVFTSLITFEYLGLVDGNFDLTVIWEPIVGSEFLLGLRLLSSIV